MNRYKTDWSSDDDYNLMDTLRGIVLTPQRMGQTLILLENGREAIAPKWKLPVGTEVTCTIIGKPSGCYSTVLVTIDSYKEAA